jgi:hypothetical protein
MIDLLDFWTQLVDVTGGTLAPEKCWCYVVDFRFKRGRWQMIESQTDNNIVIRTRSGLNHQSRIAQINTAEGSNMLGVIMSPNGETTHHVAFLRDKALRWASNIKASGTNTDEIWTALHHTIPFSLGYSLPAVTLSRKECTSIISPIVKVGLPRAGISATIPTQVRHGTVTTGGLGILDLYVFQGATQIASMVTHQWSRTPTGKLIDIAVQDLVLEMGISSISHPPTLEKGLSYATTTSWIRHVAAFMSENAIYVTSKATTSSPPRKRSYYHGRSLTIYDKQTGFTGNQQSPYDTETSLAERHHPRRRYDRRGKVDK